jgi:exodeoxyribonuclease V alpha subunit
MTIHKSQGSEFDEVVVVLPEEDNRILSRELVYTAVTRAKKTVRLVAEKEILQLALTRNITRNSGLADLLMEGRHSYKTLTR